MKRIVFHIDVNSAYLSWTAVKLLKNSYPIDIRTIEAVIGGDETKRKGIVLASSISAKKKGVKTGESLYLARKKCPRLKTFPADHELYEEMSLKLYELLKEYSPEIERYSIDECFLELSNTKYLYDDYLQLAYEIKERIKKELLFTVNVGVGSNKLLAKMASDFEKPDKVHSLMDDEVEEKLWPLEVSKLFMIGQKTSQILNELKINTVEDLAGADLSILRKRFKNQADEMIKSAQGIDNSKVEIKVAKEPSISISRTFPKDLKQLKDLKKELLKQSENIGIKLRNEEKVAYQIGLAFKTSDFKTYSRQKKLKNPLYNSEEIYEAAILLLKESWQKESLRSIGIRLSSFSKKRIYQSSLFENNNKKIDKIQETVDLINEKYHELVIKPASLYNKEEGKNE